MSSEIRVIRWTGTHPPTQAELLRLFTAEGLQPYPWSNESGDVYAAHTHTYHKVIYVVEGSITFGLPETSEELTLEAGDRLDLPAGMLHNAVVGPDGVVCLEAHR